MIDVYEGYYNKKVFIKDIYNKLEDTVDIYYKNKKQGRYKKERLLTSGWCMDRVMYLSSFPDEGVSCLYLVPGNAYLKLKIGG